MSNNENVTTLYQIYYKTKGFRPSTAQQLLKYGKCMNIHIKWSQVNKLMKNSEDYLNSLLADDILENVIVPQQEKKQRMSIKVEDGTDYYWVKDLSLNSKIEDICKKLEPRLQELSAKINLYGGNKLLSRSLTMSQLNLKDGDSISLGVCNTSIGLDSFQSNHKIKSQQHPEPEACDALKSIINYREKTPINDGDIDMNNNQKPQSPVPVSDTSAIKMGGDPYINSDSVKCIKLINDIIMIFEMTI